jgi:hypothetical protein
MQIEVVNFVAVSVGILGVVVVALYFHKAGKARADRIAGRTEMNLRQIYEANFANTSVSEERFMELWKELSAILEIPAGRLLPSDRFKVELSPTKGFEFNDQINDVMYMIGKNCQRTGVKPEQIQCVHDYIVLFGSQSTPTVGGFR